MRRAVAIALLVVALPAVLIFAAGAGDEGDNDYKIRAIVDNASFLIPGQDVKVAGAKVGVVEDLEVHKEGDRSFAAIVMRIDDKGFRDFRADAKCAVRLQSVIGEKLIECMPTQPRSAGEQEPPPLKKIPDGQPGAGQLLLPVENTVTPVDADLINNIQRRPFRERLSILLNELGTGLAARAEDIQELVERANPALKEFDEFLKILADQNKELEALTKNADTVLTALARERKSVANFFVQSRVAAQVTAEERRDFERNLQKFPPFLRQLKPFMERFDALSSAMAPVISDLRDAAPDLSRFLIALGPFSRASTAALRSLGNTADLARPILVNAEPTVRELARFTSQGKRVARNARVLFTSIQKGGGIERLMDLLFYITLSTNGFDEIGHYLRNNLIVTVCSGYAITPTVGCSANFQAASASSTATSSASPRAVASGLIDLLGLGDRPRSNGKSKRSGGGSGGDGSGAGSGGSASPAPSAPATEQPAPADGQPTEQPAAGAQPGVGSVPGDGGDPLVDYLLGGAR
jgi:phospholipid/cholesterol/gamma-HCH transport system substrate-binding protein